MRTDLSELQAAFTQAVLGRDARALQGYLVGPVEQNIARLSVYANNHHLGLRECLVDVYPATRLHMEEVAFDALARAYVSANFKTSGNTDDYGAGWAEFLSGQALAPELAELARLEWLRHLVLHASQPTKTLDLSALLALDDRALARVHLQIAPSMRIFASDYSVLTLWQAYAVPDVEPSRRAAPQNKTTVRDYCVVQRQDWQIELGAIDAAQFAFLAALSKVSMLEALYSP